MQRSKVFWFSIFCAVAFLLIAVIALCHDARVNLDASNVTVNRHVILLDANTRVVINGDDKEAIVRIEELP